MIHFSRTVEGSDIEISNVTMIEDDISASQSNAVIITAPEEGENFLEGDVLFEAQFDNPEDSEAFYELLKKSKITAIG